MWNDVTSFNGTGIYVSGNISGATNSIYTSEVYGNLSLGNVMGSIVAGDVVSTIGTAIEVNSVNGSECGISVSNNIVSPSGTGI